MVTRRRSEAIRGPERDAAWGAAARSPPGLQRRTASDELQRRPPVPLAGGARHHGHVPTGVGAPDRGTRPFQPAQQDRVGMPVRVARTDADEHRPRGDRVEEADRRVTRSVVRWILSSCTPK
jgi:hypothetical protein